MKTTITCLLALLLAGGGQPIAAQTIALEDFGDGGTPETGGWSTGPTGAAVADAGEQGIGDHALRYGSPTAGFHVFNNSSPDFTGDLASQQVGAMEFNARHSGVGDRVDLRVYLFHGGFFAGGDHAVSQGVVSIRNTMTNWSSYAIPLSSSDLILIQGTLSGLLGGVTQIGLRHDPSGAGATHPHPLSAPTDVYFDDIRLVVPEPATFALLAIIGLLALARRRR